MNKINKKAFEPLDEEERDLMESIEKDEWRSVQNIEREKEKAITEKYTQKIIEEEKRLAAEQGLNYSSVGTYTTQGSCSSCGEGFWNACDPDECLDLGDCYYTKFLLITSCHDAPSNGHNDYCLYKEENGYACNHGQCRVGKNRERLGY